MGVWWHAVLWTCQMVQDRAIYRARVRTSVISTGVVFSKPKGTKECRIKHAFQFHRIHGRPDDNSKISCMSCLAGRPTRLTTHSICCLCDSGVMGAPLSARQKHRHSPALSSAICSSRYQPSQALHAREEATWFWGNSYANSLFWGLHQKF